MTLHESLVRRTGTLDASSSVVGGPVTVGERKELQMGAHTSGPITRKCGCAAVVTDGPERGIVLCDMHNAAPELLRLLIKGMEIAEGLLVMPKWVLDVRAAIARAEGRNA